MINISNALGVTLQSDGVHRVVKVAFAIFAAVAIALKNARGIFVVATSAENSSHSDEKSSLHCRSLLQPGFPYLLILLFFFQEAQSSQVSIGEEDQKHVPVPSDPGAPFMVIHSELFLQLLIAVLDPKPFMKYPDHLS